ncbi:MAG: cyclopropane mycolic acid synthase family methyltransferase [Gordonia paraffinivorans]
MTELDPFYEDVQAHYDLSNDFFDLFLDPSRMYSCAYFKEDDYTLEQAQYAKIDLSLGKLGLEPGMRLLDIGCGWGTTIKRAMEKYDVDVIGLTLSKNQYELVNESLAAATPAGRTAEVRLQGWEEFDEPVDRIVSIGAFEHFRAERYPAFFEKTYGILPDDGVMLLHTIVAFNRHVIREKGLPITRDVLAFARFIANEIFPGGQLPEPHDVERESTRVGFTVERIQPLQQHYARTLDTWAASLKEREDDAVRIANRDVFDTYMKYLTGCADYFRNGYIDVMQFTLQK